MSTVSQRFGFLAPAPAASGAPSQPTAFPAPSRTSGYTSDAARLTGVRPTQVTSIPPEVRRELDALRAEVMKLSMMLNGAVRQADANAKSGCCPGCGPNCTCCKPLGPTDGPCCPPGDPSCDPAARFPSMLQPHWCNPFDPAHAAHRHMPAIRPHWCNPFDPACSPHANPSVVRPHWCDPASPGCAGHATPSVLAPHWCNPADPACAPHYSPAGFIPR